VTGFTTPAAQITVNDLPGAKGQAVFEDGDWVLIKNFDNSAGGLEVRELWGTVSGYTDNGDGTQTWTLAFEQVVGLVGETISENTQIVDYGQSGDGLIRRSVEGSSGPYSIIETWTNEPRVGANFTARTIVGNMDAAPQLSNGTDPQGFGLYSTNAYLEGELVVAAGDDRVEIGGGGDPYLLARQDPDNLVEIGQGFNRTEMGVTIRAAGNDVLVTDPQGAEIKNLSISGIVEGDLTIGAGEIRNDDFSYRLDDKGLSLGKVFSGNEGEDPGAIVFYNDNETRQRGQAFVRLKDDTRPTLQFVGNGLPEVSDIEMFTFGGDMYIGSRKGISGDAENLEVNIGGQFTLISDDVVKLNNYTFGSIGPLTGHPTESDLDSGEVTFYRYQDGSDPTGDYEVWVAVRKDVVNTDGAVKKTKLLD
jgi:hypothetical protein